MTTESGPKPMPHRFKRLVQDFIRLKEQSHEADIAAADAAENQRAAQAAYLKAQEAILAAVEKSYGFANPEANFLLPDGRILHVRNRNLFIDPLRKL